ncbi:FadR family transcriptional regulator [Mycolicibacterium fluoranthenivorans]|uniref:FadR family transcriptional regulator n=1 Tax=Mycolicibacterium fluoranthenivorans TaxID=258505 RepID=A0A7G8PG64_9MYCO|nr:FCD domain-containing protein [Mycolicibacterium fluoranthenivorans]QNJ93330.1 FadR family transcriptional regulator [Mycolicibacterium fluoranthenivorans]
MPVTTNDQPTTRAASVIADNLRRRIIRGELREGDALPSEQDLLVEFGVSRPTLREAIRVLESESLVVVKRGSRGGIQVSVPRTETAAHYAGLVLEYQRATLADVFRAAAAIEAPCAGMLARSHTAADIDRLRAAVGAEQDAADDRFAVLGHQNDFHRLLVELTGNATLRALSDVLRHIIEIATQRYADMRPEERPRSHEVGTRTHAKLVQLIDAGDGDAAEALWRKHISETGAQLRKAGIADSVLDLLE